jgi:hypothetical protein
MLTKANMSAAKQISLVRAKQYLHGNPELNVEEGKV